MANLKPRSASGIVVMLDLDLYLDQVRHLPPDKEWQIAEPVYSAVESTATKHNFHLVRTFGDGFLLYSLGEPDQLNLNRSISFLIALRDILAAHFFSFKAAIAAGTLILAERRSSSGENETIIAGAVANTAGKVIRKTPRGALAINWPVREAADAAETFERISRGVGRRTATVSLTNLTPLIDPFAMTSFGENISSSPAEMLAFSGGVKSTIFDTIKMADDKAKAIFAVSGGFLVYLFNGKADPSDFFVLCGGPHLTRLASWVLAMILFFASSIFALRVLYPRVGTTHKGLFFYGSIQGWGAANAYEERLKSSSLSELAKESAIHNYDISGVATRKYSMLRYSIWTMALGSLAALAFLFTQWFYFPVPLK